MLQDLCPLSVTGHTLMPAGPVAYRLMLNALEPDDAQPVSCPGARSAPPTPPPPVAAPPGEPARAGLRAARSIRLVDLRRRGLAVRVTSATDGVAKMTLSRSGRSLVTVRRAVTPGRTVTLRLRPKLGRTLLRRRSFTLRLAAVLPTGQTLVRPIRVRR